MAEMMEVDCSHVTIQDASKLKDGAISCRFITILNGHGASECPRVQAAASLLPGVLIMKRKVSSPKHRLVNVSVFQR